MSSSSLSSSEEVDIKTRIALADKELKAAQAKLDTAENRIPPNDDLTIQAMRLVTASQNKLTELYKLQARPGNNFPIFFSYFVFISIYFCYSGAISN
jgi:hypothetical protein